MEHAIGTRLRIPRLGVVEITNLNHRYAGHDYYLYRRVMKRGKPEEHLSSNAYMMSEQQAKKLEVV